MISIFKLDGEVSKAIFALEFNEIPYLFMYFNQKWVGETDLEVKSFKKDYFTSVDLNSLNLLDLGESINLNDCEIICLSKFENSKSNVKDVLYSYSDLLLVDD